MIIIVVDKHKNKFTKWIPFLNIKKGYNNKNMYLSVYRIGQQIKFYKQVDTITNTYMLELKLGYMHYKMCSTMTM